MAYAAVRSGVCSTVDASKIVRGSCSAHLSYMQTIAERERLYKEELEEKKREEARKEVRAVSVHLSGDAELAKAANPCMHCSC